MKGRAFSLGNKDSTLRTNMMSLNKNKYTSTTNGITKETLGAKLQHKGLRFSLAEKKEHPWPGGQLPDSRPLLASLGWHPLTWQRISSL